ncbi:MAG: hypothetical protein IT307_07045 [Chloroflexi bacterium]|nr:hypothetical protein [Chloroflexota bacterium]
MDDETTDMEMVTSQMREVMRRWVDDPNNEALKARYKRLQADYQRLFLDQKKGTASANG